MSSSEAEGMRTAAEFLRLGAAVGYPAQLVVPPYRVEVNEAGLVSHWTNLHGEIWVGLRLSLA